MHPQAGPRDFEMGGIHYRDLRHAGVTWVIINTGRTTALSAPGNMARKINLGAEILSAASRLPWWANLLLAAASYLLLRALGAAPPVTVAGGTPEVNFIAIVAKAMSLVLPILFCAAAVLSVIGRARRGKLLGDAQRGGADAVAGMDWREFELLVGEAFRRKGYAVVETGGGGADGGVDLVVKRGSEVALVQCKHWKAWQVGLPAVRELLGAMTAHKAAAGWLITSGRFTDEARRFARQHGIVVVDGEGLPALVDLRRASAPTAIQAAPTCPRCGTAMVLRTARRGGTAVSPFWGCVRYPACRGTRPTTADVR